MSSEISVVIPVYNARDCLYELLARLEPVLNVISSNWQLVFVDDCSTDGSFQELEKLTLGNPKILLFKNPANMGQHQSLITGISHSHGKYTVIMDCDLQDAPEIITGLYRQIRQKSCDAVIVKWINYSNGPVRYLFSRLNALKRYLQGKKNNDPNLAVFRIFNQNLKTHLLDKYKPGLLFRDIFDPEQFRITYQRHIRQKRHSGNSSYNWLKLVSTSLKN